MKLELKVVQKILNDDGTMVIVFKPVLINPISVSEFVQMGHVRLNVASANDTFVIGESYDSDFVAIP